MSNKLAILAGAIGAILATSAAHALDYDRDRATYASSTETIEVIAPRLRVERAPLNGPVNKISLSRHVRYDDLNLRTARGASELRARVRDAAQDVCGTLAQAYPVAEAPGTSCYKTALQDALLRVDGAIRDARAY
jgi:UrcA family protein